MSMAEVVLFFLAGMWVVAVVVYRTYLRMGVGGTVVLTLAALGMAGVALALPGVREMLEDAPLMAAWGRGERVAPPIDGMNARLWTLMAFGWAVVLGAGLVWRLYSAWILGRMTDEERLPDMRGVRAWLRPWAMGTVVMFAVCAWLGWKWPWWETLAGSVAALAAYPVMNAFLGEGREERAEVDSVVEERRRVLTLVETGKISGEDAAELIGALGQPQEGVVRRSGFSTGRRMMLVGAAVVLVGFFLPWFRVELSEQMRAMGEALGAPAASMPMGARVVVTVHGGEVAHGLGWVILGLGLLPGVLPLLWPVNRGNAPVQRGVTLGALGAGSVVLMYVMSTGMAEAALGVMVSVLGYAAVWAGAVREYARGAGLGVVAVG